MESILDLFSLAGRVALVVGGNRGLGLSMAKALAETGATIVIAAGAAGLGRGVPGDGRCFSVACDVCDAASVASAVSQVVAQAGRIDTWPARPRAIPPVPVSRSAESSRASPMRGGRAGAAPSAAYGYPFHLSSRFTFCPGRHVFVGIGGEPGVGRVS